jgi:glycosyltransferase involved in cell wall biosynthesis
MPAMRYRIDRLVAYLRDLFSELPKRVVLTVQYHGWRALIVRVATFPLRLTPWGSERLKGRATRWAVARRWYRRHGRPVTIVIPHYGDPKLTLQAVESIRATTDDELVDIVVSDDATPEREHVDRLRAAAGITELVESDTNTGFAANVNRGIAAARPERDIVLLNNDVIAMPGWLELLQYSACGVEDADEIGIAGPKLVYPDGTIQSAGSYRNLDAPEWFDHRYRFKPGDFGPADVPANVLATTGAAMYLKRSTLDRIGVFDEDYGMAYEDVDLCLRCWDAGLRVKYTGGSTLTHLESKTRPVEPGRRELDSQRLFWSKWGDWFDNRDVRTEDGGLRIVYVTQDTGVGGGHRVIFQHLNGLKRRGHEPELWTLADDGPPDWFDLHVPVRRFESYEELGAALEPVEAIKVATWWATAAYVWRASVRHGIAAYHVQDIETSYYPDGDPMKDVVMATYRQEFHYMAGSEWISDRLRELGLHPLTVTPGIDLDLWRPLPDVQREADVLLSAGRIHQLKNFGLTADGWLALPEDKRPRLWLFGSEPDLAEELGARHFERPSDAELNELYNRATALIQTSKHEGFCLPLLEAMSTGAPVICTDANGNRDFIRDGKNCLVVEHGDPASVAAAIERLFGDPELRARLGEAGRATAQEFDLERIRDRGERFFNEVAGPAARSATGAAPA